MRVKSSLTALAAAIVVAVASGGCGGGAKPAGDMKLPADSPAALRQDTDRLRTDLTELRTRVDAAQRATAEQVDKAAQETRAEFDAVQKAMEASARHDLQRQVEVLDAQARRIDLLEKRVADLGQTLRRVELSLDGIESQLARVLDGAAAATPSKGGAAARPPAQSAGARSAGEPSSATAAASGGSGSDTAAGAGLTPPAMLTPSRAAKSAPPAALADPARVAKAAPAPEDTKPAAPAPRPKPASAAAPAPAAGSPSARVLYDRAMGSWSKGEQGQAVVDFEELVQTYPNDPLVASAQFRIGEAYFAARDFDRAAVVYKKVVDLAPKGKDTPQALLRLGLAYRAQKREADAKQAWTQLVRDFPDSDATEEARRALRGR